MAYKRGFSLWKPKFHDGTYYCAADNLNSVHLIKSTDGMNWEYVSTITTQYKPSETALTFLKDGTLLAFSRLNDKGTLGDTRAGFSKSSPPYSSWEFKLGGTQHFSGPAAELVGNTVLVSSRTLLSSWGLSPNPKVPGDGGQRTALYIFDVDTMSLSSPVMLPTETGGDSSYPGILPTGNNRALVCWYDGSRNYGSPSPSNIWLAQTRIVPEPRINSAIMTGAALLAMSCRLRKQYHLPSVTFMRECTKGDKDDDISDK